MATWHQDQAAKCKGFRLYDDVLWNVVTDPPNGTRSIMQFAPEATAQEYGRYLAAKQPAAHRFTYILKPATAAREG
jgi:hypothetical protein